MPTHNTASPTVTSSNATATGSVSPLAGRLTVTLKHAADITGISIATLRRHKQAGRLLFIKVGGRTLVDAKSLEVMLFGQVG